MSKLDIAVIAAVLAAGAFWIESGHRVTIEAPAPGRASLAVPAACPDNDNVPYSASCLTFLKGATEVGMRWRIKAEEQPVDVPRPADFASVAACPDNDTMPYGERCLAFLTGPGWPGSR
jgi:hypothetical protein